MSADKKKEKAKRPRVSFWNESERSRWLGIYEARIKAEDSPVRAYDFANEDMEIRRLVLPHNPDEAMGMLEVFALAEQLLDELIAQRSAEVGETLSSRFGDKQLEELRAKVRASRQP